MMMMMKLMIMIPRTIFTVLSSTARSRMQEFTSGPVSESWSAPGGRQLVDQVANLTFESACYRPNIRPSPFVLLLNHKVDAHLPPPRRVEG